MCSGSEAGSYLRLIDFCMAQVAVAAVNAAVSMRKLEAPELQKTYIVMDEGERAGAVGRLSPKPHTLNPEPCTLHPEP